MNACVVCGCTENMPCCYTDGSTCFWMGLIRDTAGAIAGPVCSACYVPEMGELDQMPDLTLGQYLNPQDEPPLIVSATEGELNQYLRARAAGE